MNTEKVARMDHEWITNKSVGQTRDQVVIGSRQQHQQT